MKKTVELKKMQLTQHKDVFLTSIFGNSLDNFARFIYVRGQP